jgi:response regulator of citrate/malate metabolism
MKSDKLQLITAADLGPRRAAAVSDRGEAVLELGAFEFLTKPVDFDRLKEQLRQLPTAAD